MKTHTFRLNSDDGFGTYVKIKTGYSCTPHIYKVVGIIESNYYCDVPITANSLPYNHLELTLVANVIHCGVDESKVVRVAVKDMEEMEEHENTDTN